MNRFSILALFVLAVGLGAGATLYFTAEEPPPAAYTDPALSKARGKRSASPSSA